MKKLVWAWLAPGLLIVWPACGDATEPLGAQARKILQTHCGSCHGGGKAVKGGFGFVLDRELLVSRRLVLPGQAGKSDLLVRIQQGEMPPPKSQQRPSQAEVKILEQWVSAGAPGFEPPSRAIRKLSPREATELVLADLQHMEPRRRRFIRYLSLHHLAGAGRPEKHLATTREAAAKLLNSLSWHPRLGLPEPVDADATLLRIDLRAYQWTAAQWEKLVSAYPYRIQTSEATRAFTGLAGTEVPVLRADWLAATASRPPFYHDLLQLPGTDRALERLLQVDVPGNQRDDNVLRAGFNDSGVSRNNRLIERHDAPFGAMWRSYDFASNTGRQNLFEHPLGPHAGATSFQAAGGEVIFHLPNGLQAYLLVDAQGRRINKAPAEIVADPRRPDQRVENGLSCMSCHARGLLPKGDQLRSHVEKNASVFGQAVLDVLRATHPRPAKLQRQIEDDNRRYLRSLESFGVRDPDQEPINHVAQRFEATLDGPNAAAELGLSMAELERLLRQGPDQARILGSLLVPGGTVQRATFQEHFPELVRRLLVLQAAQAALSRPPLEAAFQGHTATVNSLAFAPDGRTAASGSDDRTIRLWEIPSGKALGTLQGPRAEVLAVAFSADGKLLLSAGSDRLVRLWDLDRRQELHVLQGHTAAVRAVAFAPDGQRAVSGGDDRSLRVWDLTRGTESFSLDGHREAVTCVAWSRTGPYLLSGSRDGTVRWWDVTQKKQIHLMDPHTGPVLCAALDPDGKTALSGGNDRSIRLWSLKSGAELHSFQGHANAVIMVQFHSGGREFFSGSSQHQGAERTWRRWDLSQRKETSALPAGEEFRLGCTAISADGRHILAGGPAGFLRLWHWE